MFQLGTVYVEKIGLT